MLRSIARATMPRAGVFLGFMLVFVVSAPAMAGARLHTAILSRDAGALTLTLGLSAAVRPRVFTLEAPSRVVIDLPDTRRGSGLTLPAVGGLVMAMRAAPRERRSYRLVLELRDAPAQVPHVNGLAVASGYRLQISLGGEPPNSSTLAATPMAQREAVPAALPPAPVARVVQPVHGPGRLGRDIVVVIDAGHGGEDPGASGPAGTHEKDVTLAIAQALAARLNERAGMRAVLTRNSDHFVPLRERMDRGRAAHADLFVSIHADSVRDRSIAGASVYTLSDRGASSEAARWLADRENAADLKGGVSLADVNQNLASVLLDLSQAATMGASVEAADEILSALDTVGAVRKKIVQHAGFVVLKSPDLPSMLIETAYISNPAEEQNLRSGAYQARLARAIESGVVAYFQRHPPDGTHYAEARRSGAGESSTGSYDSAGMSGTVMASSGT